MDKSDLLLVGFDNTDKDITVLVVSRKDSENNIRMINAMQGTDAISIYEKLVGAPLDDPIKPNNAFYGNSPCEHCGNNPANGGSGICHCILGQQTLC